jgi:hypothetical protein
MPSRPAAGNDIIISAKDNCTLDVSNWQISEQILQVARAVHFYMRCQTVAILSRQIIHQRDIAEMIPSPLVDAMCFKRISPIRAKQDQPTAGG